MTSGTTKWPTVAYHFHLDRPITIADAIKIRENGDLRAGDIWCHAECFKKQPREGSKRLPRNRKSCPHFWRGRGTGHIRTVDCKYEMVMNRKSETYRFAQFYHDLLIWLNSNAGAQNPRKLFHISEIKESKSNDADIIIIHLPNSDFDWTETRIQIVDKNRKREEKKHTLRLDISQWTDSQLADFQNSGIRKTIAEWNQLLAKAANDSIAVTDEDHLIHHDLVKGRWMTKKEQKQQEKEWIENNQSFIIQARALKRKIREEKQEAVEARKRRLKISKEDEGADLTGETTEAKVDFILRQMEMGYLLQDLAQNAKPLLNLTDIAIAKKIKEADNQLQKKIKNNSHLNADDYEVKISHYSYRLNELKQLGEEFVLVQQAI